MLSWRRVDCDDLLRLYHGFARILYGILKIPPYGKHENFKNNKSKKKQKKKMSGIYAIEEIIIRNKYSAIL